MFDRHASCPSRTGHSSSGVSTLSFYRMSPTSLANNLLWQAGAILLLALLASVAAFAQSAEAGFALAEHTPHQVLNGTAMRVSHYEPGNMLRLAIAIKSPHPAEEEQFLNDITNPKSPNFRAFLTAEEWNARFAPSAEDEQKIVDWAKSQGLTVTARFANRLDVDVEAPAGVIEKAFGVTINHYRVGEEEDFSNDRDPVLPASIAGNVAAVLGLNNIQRMQGDMPESRTVKGPDYAAGPVYAELEPMQADAEDTNLLSNPDGLTPNFTGGSLDPTDIYSAGAYDYNALRALGHCCNPHNDSGGSPAVSSIAIAAFGNVNGADVTGFHNQYPYLAVDLSPIQVDGAITCPSSNPGCYNYSDETTLDSEWTTATSNSFGSYLQTAHIYVYEGNNGFGSFYDLYNRVLSDNKTRVLTTSWSCTESYGCNSAFMSGAHSIFNSLIGQGWTLIAASGDRGATDDCAHLSVAFPGSDPDFLSAGGTLLQLNSSNDAFSSEVAWQGGQNANSCAPVAGSGGNNGGSGGGVSTTYSKPSWQSNLGGTGRQVPDLSLNAAFGQNYYFNGGLSGVGGTSIVAPELAGFFAQENSYLNAIGSICGSNHASACTPLGAPNPVLYYQGFHNYAQHNPYYDTTSGCNSNNITTADHIHYYCAGPGYDEVTGWGTANMLQLAWALNWGVLNNFANGIPNVSYVGPAVNKWYNNGQIVSWKVNDYDGNVSNPHHVGIAGFTQGWDSIPADPNSEAHGSTGTSNSFYSGPQFPNATSGCLSLVSGAGGCSGGVSQGCHTVHVRGWNNEGWSTGDTTYGPICYDTVAPVTKAAHNGTPSASGWYLAPVTVTLSATDAGTGNGTGSGVAKYFYSIDNAGCTTQNPGGCAVGSSFSVNTTGQHTVRYFSQDFAGNLDSEKSLALSVDVTSPVTTAALSPAANVNGWDRTTVKVTLSATDANGPGVAKTFYSVDSSSCIPTSTASCTVYSAAFAISTQGNHTVRFFSQDKAGNMEAGKSVAVRIDEVAPKTTASLSGVKSGNAYKGAVTVTFSGTDNLSGIDKAYYQVNGGALLAYNGPFKVNLQGTVTITFHSVDKAGNVEATEKISFVDN